MLEFLSILTDKVEYPRKDGRFKKFAIIAQEQINQKIAIFH
jgi:hypothetical protein